MNPLRRLVPPAAIAALLLLSLSACGGGGSGMDASSTTGGPSAGPGGGSAATGGMLRVRVTDAPFPFAYVESASVVIREVRVHERGSDAWTTLPTPSTEVDLVPLHDGVSMLLVEAAVPPGTYDQVRLLVEAGEVVLSDAAVVEGSSHTFTTADGRLFFPSGAQTGIKLHIENDIVVTTQLSGDLVLDFDLSKNFVFNGPVTHKPGVKRVLFTPSVRATNASIAGSAELSVFSDALTPGDTTDDVPIDAATVRAFDAAADPAVDPSVATASTDASGHASLSLPPGAYQLVVEATGHASKTVTGVDVVVANVTDVGNVVLEATGTISGVVMSDAATPADPADDVVVAGATVDVLEAGTTTLVATTVSGVSGEFQVAGLAAGSYDVAIHAAGFTDLVTPGVLATVVGSGATHLLSALSGDVKGTVTALADGSAISGATVRIVNEAGVEVALLTTDAAGTWAKTLATGTYELTFSSGAPTAVRAVVVVGASPPPPPVVVDVAL